MTREIPITIKSDELLDCAHCAVGFVALSGIKFLCPTVSSRTGKELGPEARQSIQDISSGATSIEDSPEYVVTALKGHCGDRQTEALSVRKGFGTVQYG